MSFDPGYGYPHVQGKVVVTAHRNRHTGLWEVETSFYNNPLATTVAGPFRNAVQARGWAHRHYRYVLEGR